ncbi:secreted protease [Helicobacter cholecystus]|uniref:S41 family peptidase n=1 Tax=Helicobacter cholecystus TaxID=45498 RepID=UPI000CF15035|nr:S41 family peptidase [Helicobacter cholecystus]VEJ24427.1 secreted protease [Helicobacter cholecystus]
MKNHLKFLGFGSLILALCIAVGLYAVEQKDQKEQQSQNRLEPYKKLRKVINLVETSYVDEVELDKIVDKAIEGLLNNLDAHSAYLDEKKFRDLQTQTNGEFGGIGITLGMKDGALTVIAPLDDSPADKVGIKAGDVILKINDKNTLNMSIDDAVNIMRGKAGTSLELTIYRKNESKPLIFNLKRDNIKIDSVFGRKIDGTNFYYLRVTSFDKNVASSVQKFLKKAGKIDGIILDLRNNPGGLLNQAVALSELFIKEGVVVSQKGRNKNENIEFKVDGKAPYATIPLVVLINGGSASASEIVAGALQDHKRAVLVGEQSFGKGSVQIVLELGKTDALKLTTAKYYLPSGRTIQAVGVKPDIQASYGKVPQSQKSGFEIKESDLRMHLENELEKIDQKENKKDKQKSPSKEKTITQEDINNDNQLKVGIDTLKAWSVIKQ